MNTIPAFATNEQEHLATRKKRKAILKPINSLIDELRSQQARTKDFLVPYAELSSVVKTVQEHTVDNEGNTVPIESYNLNVCVGKEGCFPLYERVLQHICTHCSQGNKATLPKRYLTLLLNNRADTASVDLASKNVNHWLQKRAGETHRGGATKRVLVRMLETKEGSGEFTIRAIQSDKYFPINSLDLVTQALLQITGKLKAGKHDDGESLYKGARAFDWNISPYGMKLGLANPGFAFDLKNPDAGIQEADLEPVQEREGITHKFLYPGGVEHAWGGKYKANGTHLVYPAAFIKNDDAGGGSAEIRMGLYEAICDNTAAIGIDLVRRHLGSRLEEVDQYESDATHRKKMEYVLSSFADGMRQVFDKEEFEKNCLKFLGLFDAEITDVKETLKFVTETIKVDGLLDDLLQSYTQFSDGKNTLGDVQRALTNVAQEQPDHVADDMIGFAGKMIQEGKESVKKNLLVSA